jgi:VWFA-related protein
MPVRNWILVSTVLWMNGASAQPQDASAAAQPTIKAETRLVLVDTVVTDKKGAYIHDLTVKDFKVLEDNKEQAISSFSFEADPASPTNAQKRYLVLFFDNSTMQLSDQTQARQAATKFIDANAGPNRLTAIVNFGGSLQIAQNFTADADRLKKVVSGVKFSSVSPNGTMETASLGGAGLSRAEANFGMRDSIMALRSLAKNLTGVPGRKILILLTAGFPFSSDIMPEVTATIDACNKANVAIYPIDVRGLVADVPSGGPGPRGALLEPSIFQNAFFQRGATGGTGGTSGGGGAVGGHGGTTGGGTTGGGTTGSRGGTTTGGTTTGTRSTAAVSPTGTLNSPYGMNPNNMPSLIVPPFPKSASTNQEIMYTLASGTGGFVIVNTNDLVGGLEKIGKEQDEYYILGYTPPESNEDSCHVIKVKVERSGTVVRARSGYCNSKPRDMLAGNSTEKELENRASAAAPGNIAASMQLPFFYTSANTARVNVAMEIPSDAIKFDKIKGKLHSAVNVLGIAYKPDGGVAARFSDTLKLDFENKKDLEAFQEHPLHYENQFDVASGQYSLKVVFSSGDKSFGKLEMPLVVDPYDTKQFGMSGVAFAREVHRVSDTTMGVEAALLDDRTPLVTKGVQIIPSGTNRFKPGVPIVVYLEMYEPLLVAPTPPLGLVVAVQLRVLDRNTGAEKFDSGLGSVVDMFKPGNPVIPIGLQVPAGTLVAGSYRVELSGQDSMGKSIKRSADLDLQ